MFSACNRKQIVSEESRKLTMRDQTLKFGLEDDDRFHIPDDHEPAASSMAESSQALPVKATVIPARWQEQAGNMFRLLNYSFGEGGEAYLSLSQGGVLENINRWRAQFGVELLADLSTSEAVETAGYNGVWVKVDGDFGGAMGAEAKNNWALRGIVVQKGEQILTVKLMGPQSGIQQAEQELREFVAGLSVID